MKGAAGNLGMYASGIPFGLLVDSKGPRIAIIIGAFTVGGGYYPVYLGPWFVTIMIELMFIPLLTSINQLIQRGMARYQYL